MRSSFLKISIAAVLVLLLFCGAAVAAPTDISDRATYISIFSGPTLAAATYTISGSDWNVPSLHNGTDSLTLIGDVVLDFSGFTGGFDGVSAGEKNSGAIFGNVNLGNYALEIRNITMDSVNVIPAGDYNNIGGIIGYANGNKNVHSDKLNFTNCILQNCVIGMTSGGTFVGGLVGNTIYLDVTVKNCSLTYCEVTSSNGAVAGLVGSVAVNSPDFSPNRVGVTVEDCTVANCYIHTIRVSYGNCVGGLIGYIDGVVVPTVIMGCNIENTSIYGESYSVGGLIGWARPPCNVSDTHVTNCVIASSSKQVGGLIGSINKYTQSTINTINITECDLEHCAVRGSGGNTGGLVGELPDDLSSISVSDNNMKNCTVRDLTGANLICGNNNSALAGGCVESENYINNATVRSPNIDIEGSWSMPKSVRVGGISITNLIQDGKVMYGTKYTILVYPVPTNGRLNPSSTEETAGTEITVTVTANTGYHLNWSYYYKEGDSTSLTQIQSPYTFQLPQYHINISGDFKANVTNVTYYNLTEFFDSKLNTYKENTKATTKSVPTRIGYDFAGWNVSREDGTPFNSGTYNNTGTWNYTGAHYTGEGEAGILKVYANWTPITYNVSFNKTTGAGTMDNQTLTYDKKENLHPNRFTKAGYTFVGWNKTSETGTDIDFTDGYEVLNLTEMKGDTIYLYAVWKENPPQPAPPSGSSSRNYGGSVWVQETAAPTPVPTDAAGTNTTQILPTASPVNPSQQASSPVPVAGVLAGLGAACVLFGLRRK